MSEKEVRNLVCRMDELYGPIHPFVEDVDVLLNREPDVVVLLRWLEDWGKIPLPMKVSHESVLGTVAQWAEHEFHVRLTADDWEWVEEGE